MTVIPLMITWVGAVLVSALDGRRDWVGWLAVGGLAASLAATGWLAVEVAASGPVATIAGGWRRDIGIELRADTLAVVFSATTLLVMLVATAQAVRDGESRRWFPAVALFLATGLQGVFVTRDLFNLYVFFEISVVASFVLVGFGHAAHRGASGWSTLVFGVLNLFGSLLFLAPVAMIYHVTGSLHMAPTRKWAATGDPETALLVAALMFVAFSIKLALFPFHFWLPDIYRDSSPHVAAMLSGALANIGSYGYIRFGAELFPVQTTTAGPWLLAIGSLSLLYGAWQAISCRTLGGVLAYSSVSQAGYILVAVVLAPPIGAAAAVVFAVANALNKSSLFLTLDGRDPSRDTLFAGATFSVAGVPPTVGFVAKALVVWTAIEAARPDIVAVLVVGSGLGFVYMFRAYDKLRELRPTCTPLAAPTLIGALVAVIVGLGIWPEPLLAVAEHVADQLGGSP